jgi:hypothetical protein
MIDERTKQEARRRALAITETIERHHTRADGIIVCAINDSEKDGGRERPLVDDLGDFLPFTDYFGRRDIGDRHIAFLEARGGELAYRYAFDFTDMLLGLAWRLAGPYADEASRRALARCADAFLARHWDGQAVRSYRFGPLAPALLSGQDTAFVEAFLELSDPTGDAAWASRAESLAAAFTAAPLFEASGLVPDTIARGKFAGLALSLLRPESAGRARMVKANANLGFGFLEAKRRGLAWANEPLEKLTRAILDGVRENGGAPGNDLLPRATRTPDLLAAFSTIDFLCDAAALSGSGELLDAARGIANFWLAQQSPVTGLFPKKAGGKTTYVDSETDMSVALLRLWEHTGDDAHLSSAIRCVDGVHRFHFRERGLVLEVDVASGEVADPLLKGKFQALALKPLIYMIDGRRIIDSPELERLMRDR